ncbi:MMPL family transporter [Campylobacter sp. CCS1377]|uniref:MMPL family transporter n=1 Tax=Campylobacter sp. CCS1377 TaxID=3158229 RepID=A0AAU7E628_9BACT|nr:MMPL family transporter [Campylobacter jejuni]
MLVKFFKFLITYPKSVFFGTLLICIILSSFAFKLEVDASAESLLLEDDKDLKIFREFSKHYKSDNFLMLSFKPKDEKLFSKENLDKLTQLHQELEQVKGVERVFSMINAPLLQSSSTQDLKELLKNIPTIQNKDINLTKAKEEFLNSPFYKNNIISKDAKTTALIIYLKADAKYLELIDLRDKALSESEKNHYRLALNKHQEKQNAITKQILNDIKLIQEKYKKSQDELYLGGVSMIADDMITYIKNDLLVYGASLAPLLALALWGFFKKLRLVIFPLFVCFISLFSVSGLFALMNFKITVISSNYVALMLIITLSVVIHLISHFTQLTHKFSHSKIQRLILASLLAKSKPSFYAILTTIIGFLSLMFSGIEPIIKLGIMMSLGISVSLVLSFVFFASLFMLLKPIAYPKNNFKLHLLQFCTHTCFHHRKTIYIISALIFILSLYGILQLRVENSFVNYFKDGSEIKEGLLVIDKNLGGTLPLDIIIKFKDQDQNITGNEFDSFENEFAFLAQQNTYWFNSHKTRIAKKVHEFLENKEFIGSVLSLNSLLSLGKSINNNQDLDDFALAFLNENLPDRFKQDLLSPFVNITHNELRFSLRIMDSHPLLQRAIFLKELENELNILLAKDEVSVHITGIMLLYNNMLQSLFKSQFNTLSFVILAIFVLFVLIFRSLKLSVIAIFSNIIALGVIFALMGLANLPLDIMSITIAAICIGIGVDDTIHYIYRFKKELRHNNLENAILKTHYSIGSALYYTSFSIVLGFSVMVSSNFIPTIYFGLLTLFIMMLLLLSSLILLPSLLITFRYKLF